jgi:hypothetical protein
VRKLPAPGDDPVEVFLLCIGRVRSPGLRARLNTIVEHVGAAAEEYRAALSAEEAHSVTTAVGVAGVVTAHEMASVYEQRLAGKRGPGRAVYDNLMALPPNGICPYCVQRTVATLDHYLPKMRYSPLAVCPTNLVPCCADCNKAKLDIAPTCAEDAFPHPYFDNLQGRWLFAHVLAPSPPAVVFDCVPPADWTHEQAERYRRYFRALRLGELYSAHSAEELSMLQGLLRRIHERGGEEAVSRHLTEVAAGIHELRENSWRAALYDALADSSWYCGGGFLFEPAI